MNTLTKGIRESHLFGDDPKGNTSITGIFKITGWRNHEKTHIIMSLSGRIGVYNGKTTKYYKRSVNVRLPMSIFNGMEEADVKRTYSDVLEDMKLAICREAWLLSSMPSGDEFEMQTVCCILFQTYSIVKWPIVDIHGIEMKFNVVPINAACMSDSGKGYLGSTLTPIVDRKDCPDIDIDLHGFEEK